MRQRSLSHHPESLGQLLLPAALEGSIRAVGIYGNSDELLNLIMCEAGELPPLQYVGGAGYVFLSSPLAYFVPIPDQNPV